MDCPSCKHRWQQYILFKDWISPALVHCSWTYHKDHLPHPVTTREGVPATYEPLMVAGNDRVLTKIKFEYGIRFDLSLVLHVAPALCISTAVLSGKEDLLALETYSPA